MKYTSCEIRFSKTFDIYVDEFVFTWTCVGFQYLTTEYSILTEVMENLVGIRDKEDIATTMIHILQKLDKAKLFLTDVVISEVTRQGQLGLS